MKSILVLLFVALHAKAQTIIPVPIVATNGQFVAQWYQQPSVERTNSNIFVQPIANYWLPEVNVDGQNWVGFRSELVLLPPRSIRPARQPCACLHSIEVVNATDQVRIRLVSY